MAEPITLDLRGLQCPLPVLKTRNGLRKLAEGEHLHVRTDDPMAVIDLPNFCNEYAQELIEQKPDPDGSHWFLIARRGDLR